MGLASASTSCPAAATKPLPAATTVSATDAATPPTQSPIDSKILQQKRLYL